MSAFVRTARGIEASFDPMEINVLTHIVSEVLELLASDQSSELPADPLAQAVGISTNDRLPEDPALARLLPNAYENDQHASEFRRYTEHGLRGGKIKRLQEMRDSFKASQQVRLNAAQAEVWAMALNDLRLTLGVRLDVDEESERVFAARPDDDPEKGAYTVFAWLGWLQQTLIEALEED